MSLSKLWELVMDREAWSAAVHRITKRWTQLSDWTELNWIVRAFPGGSDTRESACNGGDLGLIPGSGRFLERKMATHSSILAWRICGQRSLKGYSPWDHKVGHDWIVRIKWKRFTYKIKIFATPNASVEEQLINHHKKKCLWNISKRKWQFSRKYT